MKKKLGKRPNRRGMSLLTALVAMVIMAFAILGVAKVFLQAMQSNGTAGAVMEAMNLAQLVTERAILLPDDDPNVINGRVIHSGDTDLSSTLGIAAGVNFNPALYTFVCTIDPNDVPISAGVPLERMAKITVSVQYTNDYAGNLGTTPAGSEVRVVTYRYRNTP
jgi:type II secretory pathway pseudopilin PulG